MIIIFLFFFFLGGGGGGVGRRGGWSKGIFFSQSIKIKKMPILDLELAIDHPLPRRSFVHYDFLKIHYI